MFRWLRRPITKKQKRAYRSRPPGGIHQENYYGRLFLLFLFVLVILFLLRKYGGVSW